VPSAIRNDHDLAKDGLVSILVECQGANEAQLEAFMWQRFSDNECFTSVGTFVPIPDSKGIPHGGLIGVDGKLLWAGNPLGGKQQVEQLIEEQLKLVKKGWGDSSEARKVRAQLYGKGNLASAASIVAEMADGEEKTTLQQEVDKRYAVRKAAIDALMKGGCWLEAEDDAKQLLKDVGKHETWSAEVTELVAMFETDEGKAELAADKKLEKIVKQLRKGKHEKAPKALEKLIEKIGETSVGARASRMLAALSGGS